MKRKQFIKKSMYGFGSLSLVPFIACTQESTTSIGCNRSPSETSGPFPIKSPNTLKLVNIIADRTGVPLTIKIFVKDSANACLAREGVFVDIWHCDKDGNYSEYGSSASKHFLRGRQLTDQTGLVTFSSIYPGWYPGRAPHVHVEVLSNTEKSLLTTQIAFDENKNALVYASAGYRGKADTSNKGDNLFDDSLDANMHDSITGSIATGYVMTKTIII
jgi:protocatechuate 3,4-dioxygenase beta subunit